jgi:hypothetical protein
MGSAAWGWDHPEARRLQLQQRADINIVMIPSSTPLLLNKIRQEHIIQAHALTV